MNQESTTMSNKANIETRAANIAGDEQLSAREAAVACFKEYARERPEVVALWTFGIGFVLGWKLKIW